MRMVLTITVPSDEPAQAELLRWTALLLADAHQRPGVRIEILRNDDG